MTDVTRKPNYAALRDQMRDLRDERGLTFDQLAERSGVDRRTLLAMQKGKTNGRLDSWFSVAQALDVEPGEFFSVI
ncbi:MAG: helix-turn-helix transcriptional regulator [Leucobacter sp.]